MKCYVCKYPITGNSKFVKGDPYNRRWHMKCFNCYECKCSLVGKGIFFNESNNILCPTCKNH